MHSRSRPSSKNFFAFAADVFSGLPLKVETKETPMWYASIFKSRYIVFDVYFDIRDSFVGCSIKELRDVTANTEIKLTPYCPLEGFLIKDKGYRGSLSEFRPKEVKLTYWKMDLLMYSNAIQHFFKNEIQENA